MLTINQWKEIITMQKKLDQRIIQEKSLEKINIRDKRFLALIVELSEFSNELRYFKYWSVNQTYQSYEKVLDEYVDCLHFLVSIGLTDSDNLLNYHYQLQPEVDIVKLILQLNHKVLDFWQQKSNTYNLILDDFFTIATLLKISNDKIYQTYLNKNQINHQRITNKY